MPYDGQLSAHRSISKIVNNKRIYEKMSSWKIINADNLSSEAIQFSELSPSAWMPRYIVAIDGSKQEEYVKNGFPAAEVAYITVASALLDIEKLKQLDKYRPVEPQKFYKTEQHESIEMVFPGANIAMEGDNSPEETMRKVLYNTLQEIRIMGDDSETLLETYEALLKYRIKAEEGDKAVASPRCPYDDCMSVDKKMVFGTGTYQCTCPLKKNMYSTDIMRLHEEFNPIGTSVGMFSLIMQAVERIFLMNIIRRLDQKGWHSTFNRIGFIVDGALAIHSRASWLSNAIQKELTRINTVVKQKTGNDILLLGVEKTGAFIEHFESINTYDKDNKERIPKQTAILLTDKYIKTKIRFSNSTKPYGEGTYFGRKFFYKTKSGSLIVATIPFLADEHMNLDRSDPSLFPRIEDAMSLLDSVASSMYPNALSPIISAHNEATIPMNIGKRVLEELAKSLIKN